MHDLLIVGSGPAGFAAALGNPGQDVLVIDPGFAAKPAASPQRGTLLTAKRAGEVDLGTIIGEGFESLHNVHGDYLSPKLKGPLMRFISEGVETFTPVRSSTFTAQLSLARGGLANAWGAGAFRYDASELAAFPFEASELTPHYQALIEFIGVTGARDDLEPTFGSVEGHLPAPALNTAGTDLFARYARHRRWLTERGLRVGLPRLALLSREHQGRPAYGYDGMEFFRPHDVSIFNPGQALLALAASGRVRYRPGIVAERFQEDRDGVTLFGRDVSGGPGVTLRARRLVLAAGALNSARIVLASAHDTQRRLPVRDNLLSFVPLLDPRRIGGTHDENCLPAQAVLVFRDESVREPVQMTFYGLNTTLWGDLAFDMPLPATRLPNAIRALVPALRILQVFYPDTGPAAGHCRLGSDGALEIDYRPHERGALERRLLRLMRRLGYLGHPALNKYPPPGSCFHYAGTLPMRRAPRTHETTPEGALAGCSRVFVVDAAIFPELPSKNLTLTIMANSRRITERLYQRSPGA